MFLYGATSAGDTHTAARCAGPLPVDPPTTTEPSKSAIDSARLNVGVEGSVLDVHATASLEVQTVASGRPPVPTRVPAIVHRRFAVGAAMAESVDVGPPPSDSTGSVSRDQSNGAAA